MKRPKIFRKISFTLIFTIFVLLTMIGSIIYAAIRIHGAPAEHPSTGRYTSTQLDYMLMISESVFGIVISSLLFIIRRKFKIKLPNVIYIMFFLFLYCAIFLGEVQHFYYTVPHWDTILHTFSAALLGLFGISVIDLINKTDKISFSMSPFFIVLFGFCFAVSLGTVWEIYEYTMDGLLKTNMQKFNAADGTALIGRAALGDTMKDIITDVLGALAMAAVGFFIIKSDKNKIEKLELKREITQQTHG